MAPKTDSDSENCRGPSSQRISPLVANSFAPGHSIDPEFVPDTLSEWYSIRNNEFPNLSAARVASHAPASMYQWTTMRNSEFTRPQQPALFASTASHESYGIPDSRGQDLRVAHTPSAMQSLHNSRPPSVHLQLPDYSQLGELSHNAPVLGQTTYPASASLAAHAIPGHRTAMDYVPASAGCTGSSSHDTQAGMQHPRHTGNLSGGSTTSTRSSMPTNPHSVGGPECSASYASYANYANYANEVLAEHWDSQQPVTYNDRNHCPVSEQLKIADFESIHEGTAFAAQPCEYVRPADVMAHG